MLGYPGTQEHRRGKSVLIIHKQTVALGQDEQVQSQRGVANEHIVLSRCSHLEIH